VADAYVDAVRLYVAPQVWTMIELQRLTGMRPGEVCQMRTCDLVTSGRIWEYRPSTHKTAHHGKSRVVFIGPQAQQVLHPWLRAELEAFLFQPREAEAQRRAEQRANRKTPVQPSQRDRSKSNPRKTPGERYTATSYCRAITQGIRRANAHRAENGPEIPHWHPHQLRHSAATRLRREFGLDTARAVLGHSSPIVSEIYAELDQFKASEAMSKIG
jgi:integrase